MERQRGTAAEWLQLSRRAHVRLQRNLQKARVICGTNWFAIGLHPAFGVRVVRRQGSFRSVAERKTACTFVNQHQWAVALSSAEKRLKFTPPHHPSHPSQSQAIPLSPPKMRPKDIGRPRQPQPQPQQSNC